MGAFGRFKGGESSETDPESAFRAQGSVLMVTASVRDSQRVEGVRPQLRV
jgi:hypothetical protein